MPDGWVDLEVVGTHSRHGKRRLLASRQTETMVLALVCMWSGWRYAAAEVGADPEPHSMSYFAQTALRENVGLRAE